MGTRQLSCKLGMSGVTAVAYDRRHRENDTMHPLLRCTAAVGWLLAAVPPGARADGPDATTTARLSVVAADLAGAGLVDFCVQRAPARADAVRAAWSDWRRRARVDDVRRHVDPGWLVRVQGSVAAGRPALHDRMAARGTPDAVCDGVVASFAEPGMDMARQYPLAYADGPARAPSPGPGATGATGATTAPLAAPAPQAPAAAGTVFTVAQLEMFYLQGTLDDRRRRLRQPIFVTGRVVQRGEHWFVEHDDATFTTRMAVSPGFGLAAHAGQVVVLSGTLDELPGSLAFLRNGRLVSDPSRLAPSTLVADSRLLRRNVPMDRVRAAPGDGVRAGDIAAVLFSGKGTMLLLDDGWLYNRPGAPPPSDLDVKASRSLEPNYWHRWKSAGGGKYLVRWADLHGQHTGDWKPISGMWTVRPWPGGKVPPVEYVYQNFTGNLGTGGVYAKSLWQFGADGRFTTSAYLQAGSGTMAANNGFVAAQTTLHGPQGGQTTGFANSGAGTVTNQRTGGDGSDRRGTWRIDGFTLELRYDNGRVARVLAFPWDEKAQHIWINDTAYMSKVPPR